MLDEYNFLIDVCKIYIGEIGLDNYILYRTMNKTKEEKEKAIDLMKEKLSKLINF